MAHTILLALQDADERSRLADVLSEVGYHVTAAATFKSAGRLLASTTPNVLVAEVRMGVYNGLQLLVTGRIDNPRLAGIMIAEGSNGSFAEEARHLGATDVLPRPVESLALLDCVSRALDAIEARHQPRRPVSPGISCEVEGHLGWIVEASEDGMRVELPHPVSSSSPTALELTVPTLDLSLPARLAWTGGPLPTVFRYGLALLASDSSEARDWRRLVHALPER